MKRSLVGFVVAALVAVFAVRCDKPSPTVQGVVIIGGGSFVHKNLTSQLTATANFSSGAPQDVTSTATWTSSDNNVATVTSGGLVRSAGNGVATITATYQGRVGTLTVAVVLTASPKITTTFTRLCSPSRARVVITISEDNGDIGFDLTALAVTMQLFGVVKHFHQFTNAEMLAAFGGTLHWNASQSKSITYDGTYAGNADTSDSNGFVDAAIVDDLFHVFTPHVDLGFNRDGC